MEPVVGVVVGKFELGRKPHQVDHFVGREIPEPEFFDDLHVLLRILVVLSRSLVNVVDVARLLDDGPGSFGVTTVGFGKTTRTRRIASDDVNDFGMFF